MDELVDFCLSIMAFWKAGPIPIKMVETYVRPIMFHKHCSYQFNTSIFTSTWSQWSNGATFDSEHTDFEPISCRHCFLASFDSKFTSLQVCTSICLRHTRPCTYLFIPLSPPFLCVPIQSKFLTLWKRKCRCLNTWTACVKLLADALTGDDRIKSITVAEQGLGE